MGKSGVSAAAIEAAMSARIAELKASSQVEVEAKVQAALAARIESAKAQITAEATKMGDLLTFMATLCFQYSMSPPSRP